MLSQEELHILGAIHIDDTISELESRLDGATDIETHVETLVDCGLLRRSGEHISPSRSSATVSYRDLVMEYHYVDFHEVLTPDVLRLLFYLDFPMGVSTLASWTDLSESTVDSILKPLCHRTFLQVDDGLYHTQEIGESLVTFARELVYHLHREKCNTVTPRGTVRWATPEACLLKTTADITHEHFCETGPVRLDEFGVRLLVTNQRYYYHQHDGDISLSVGDVVCHLLIDSIDVRNVTYGLLALAHEDTDEQTIVTRAKVYGVAPLVTKMFEFLEEQGTVEPEGFPTWERFEEQAEMYDIVV